MSKLTWDEAGQRFFHYGTNHGVVYPMASDGTYPHGYAWNGLTGVDENPDGAEEQVLWADNIKYATYRTPENHKGNIKAYFYPDEWKPCIGLKSLTNVPGVTFGQQNRQPFGLCYRSELGNDTAIDSDDGYELHIVYNSTVSPSSVSRVTKNENPDAVEFSWDYSSTPIVPDFDGIQGVEGLEGIKEICTITISTLNTTKAKMAALEAILYGDDNTDPRLPLPAEIVTLMKNP